MSWFPEQTRLQAPPTGDCLWCGGNTFEGFKCKICSPTRLEVDKEEDIVNKPAHYNHNETGIECIDAIKAATGEHYEGYLQGNIIKYIWRYRYKNRVEDLQKAQVYTKWLEDHCKEKM